MAMKLCLLNFQEQNSISYYRGLCSPTKFEESCFLCIVRRRLLSRLGINLDFLGQYDCEARLAIFSFA